jgi:hypothetical protein
MMMMMKCGKYGKNKGARREENKGTKKKKRNGETRRPEGMGISINSFTILFGKPALNRPTGG